MKIMLDAGHGGKDSGAIGFGLKEKDLTLAIVKKIGALLGGYEGVEVLYTRTDDRFLELSERAALANQAKADFFHSIHINATPSGTGFESFIHTNASSKSVAYQNVIHPEIMKAIGNVKDRGKKRANYAVIRETHMPAILTENLFIDNSADNKLLAQEAFLDKVAEGHVNGYAKAFGLTKKAALAPKLVDIQTGGLSTQMLADLANFIASKSWYSETPGVKIGHFYEGTPELTELESWLKARGWYYVKG